jgi:hypothetical protein
VRRSPTRLPRPTALAAPALATAVLLLLAACGDASDGPSIGDVPDATGDATDEDDADPVAAHGLRRCSDVPEIALPEERYGDDPIYVANEMPVEEVQAWATGQPGFQELWIDRERNGWITVAFTEDADERQQELDARFPDDGVVAVEVDYDLEELQQLQHHASEVLTIPHGSSVDIQRGVVQLDLGVLTDERLAEVAEHLDDEPVCVEGTDPADAPEPGEQADEGDGWRLLAAEQGAGFPYRTGIATHTEQYADLWDEAGVSTDAPDVDLDAEVVLWFGAVHGSGCDDLRLDDVVVDHDAARVHADIVLVDSPAMCPSDANPFAFLVALERDRLPAGPFHLQLGASDPPMGAPEERTYVEVDLTEPGSTASEEDLRTGTIDDLDEDPRRPRVEPGGVIEEGVEFSFHHDARCGADWLGPVNDRWWHAEEVGEDLPEPWLRAAEEAGRLHLTMELAVEPDPHLSAEAGGHEVVYAPSSDDPPC